ncbi:MAG: ABC transporter ATP-binding protein [Betaproteobacteria bacterium]|nr:ABC transporter ATP-binding protein [Betaproteobacteria bacterium]
MLSAHGLDIAIGGRSLVGQLELDIAAGQCWALLGRNGAGKTSLLLALAGLRVQAAGTVALNGRGLAQHSRRELALRIGVLLQDESTDFGDSLLDYVLLGRYPHSRSAYARDPAAAAAATEWLGRLELLDHRGQPYRTLSGGERQRARIAQLLVQDPDVLLLDEPLNHLDLRHQVSVMQTLSGLAHEGKAVMMALHEPNLAARYCDHSVLLYDSGRAGVGRSGEMLTQANLETLYRCPLESAGTRIFIPS